MLHIGDYMEYYATYSIFYETLFRLFRISSYQDYYLVDTSLESLLLQDNDYHTLSLLDSIDQD